VQAAAQLKKEGIMTLGTCLFSVPQAVAASQAGMVAVSMYLNGEFAIEAAALISVEPLAGTDKNYWPDLKDPEVSHPMAARHARIRLIYDKLEKETGQKQPHLKTAS
jgi:transaldolase